MKEEKKKCFVHFLLTCSSEQFDYILHTLTKEQLQTMIEILLNVVKGVCPISDHNKTVLVRRKRIIREVLLPKLTQLQRKRRLIKIKKTFAYFFMF